ncbi:InlB B-repeat-containing protein [Coprobacillus cateniformis]|uniref:InlB B-repeat-containing protein n=1 Tax=Coprobacillus cateniformis TaxID=100884 RepID=UPI0026661788|nr:InlB B-repeat-containing protein [Coprobacillus cateniformis]
MKKWKLSFTIFLMILGCCFTKVIALETLEERFQVILANGSSKNKTLNVDLSGNVSVIENPSVRYYCTEDVRETLYNAIAPSKGTALLWYDVDTKKNKNWYSLGGSVSGGWANNSKSALTFNSVDVTATTPYIRLPKVSKVGYTFIGWSITERQTPYYYHNGSIKSTSGSSSVVNKNGWYEIEVGMYSNALTVKPNFKINSYNVTFVDGLGNTLKTQSVNYGSNATPPATPTRVGYTFNGWSGSYNNITSSRTITAIWRMNSYNVTFVDGLGNTLKTQSVNYGSNATPPANPTREGYVFNGWNGSYNNVNSSRTITATWKPITLDVILPESLNIYQQGGTENLKIDPLNIINNSVGVIDINRLRLTVNGITLVNKDIDFKKMPIDSKKMYLEYQNHNLMNDYTQLISIASKKNISIDLKGKMGISSYTSVENIGQLHLTMKIRGQ